MVVWYHHSVSTVTTTNNQLGTIRDTHGWRELVKTCISNIRSRRLRDAGWSGTKYHRSDIFGHQPQRLDLVLSLHPKAPASLNRDGPRPGTEGGHLKRSLESSIERRVAHPDRTEPNGRASRLEQNLGDITGRDHSYRSGRSRFRPQLKGGGPK